MISVFVVAQLCNNKSHKHNVVPYGLCPRVWDMRPLPDLKTPRKTPSTDQSRASLSKYSKGRSLHTCVQSPSATCNPAPSRLAYAFPHQVLHSVPNKVYLLAYTSLSNRLLHTLPPHLTSKLLNLNLRNILSRYHHQT